MRTDDLVVTLLVAAANLALWVASPPAGAVDVGARVALLLLPMFAWARYYRTSGPTCASCRREILEGPYLAMQVFSFHPLCGLRFVDRTPEQDHDIGWAGRWSLP